MSNLINVFVDFESYYAKDFGFRTHTTQEYVMGDQWETLMMGIAVEDYEPIVHVGEANVRMALDALPWDKVRLVCQQTIFDGAIVAWRYGHIPAQYADTKALASVTGLDKPAKGASLSALATILIANGYELPPKGTYVENMIGKHLADFTPHQLESAKAYCADDVRTTRAIYNALVGYVPAGELDWHDLVIRMAIQPQLKLDADTITEELARVHEQREELQASVMRQIGITNDVEFMTTIRSNPRFADILRQYGCEPPVKISKTTGKESYALAKTDAGMMALLEHDTPEVRVLAEARLGLKTSIDISRCHRLLKLAELPALSMPYKVSGTMTHRLGGCVTADTRVLVKTAGGTITERRIVDVRRDDLVWDGQEFVSHDGVVYSGQQEVIHYGGITGTPDHKVYINENDTVSLLEAMQTGARIMDCPAPPDWAANADG